MQPEDEGFMDGRLWPGTAGCGLGLQIMLGFGRQRLRRKSQHGYRMEGDGMSQGALLGQWSGWEQYKVGWKGRT